MAMVSPASADLHVFINDTDIYEPKEIMIFSPDPIDIPIYIIGDSLYNHKVEPYIWIEAYGRRFYLYLSEEGTVDFKEITDNSELKPVVQEIVMPEYINGYFRLLDDTTSLNDVAFDFYLCLDPVINGSFDSDAATCGMRKVLVNNGCIPTQISLSRPYIYEELQTTGTAVTPKTIDVTVTDDCGNPISFDITPANESWFTTSKTTGMLTLTLKGAGNTTLTISSGTLTPATYSITAILDQCLPQAQPIVNPNSVTGFTTPGDNYSFTLRVTDGCNNLAFTATPDPIDRITIKNNADNSKEITYKIYSTDANPQYTGKVTVSIPSKGFQTAVNITINVSAIIPLSGPYGQYRDFIVKANNYKMFKLFATASLKNRPLQIGMTDTAPWEGGWNLDMVVKWAGTNCELGEPTMNDYNKIRPFAEADPINHGCLNGLNEGCIVPSLSQGPNIGYYYYKFSLYGPDEFLDIAGGNSAYPDYPDQPHGCYYIMIVNNTTHNKTVSMTWADNDAP